MGLVALACIAGLVLIAQLSLEISTDRRPNSSLQSFGDMWGISTAHAEALNNRSPGHHTRHEGWTYLGPDSDQDGWLYESITNSSGETYKAKKMLICDPGQWKALKILLLESSLVLRHQIQLM